MLLLVGKPASARAFGHPASNKGTSSQAHFTCLGLFVTLSCHPVFDMLPGGETACWGGIGAGAVGEARGCECLVWLTVLAEAKQVQTHPE